MKNRPTKTTEKSAFLEKQKTILRIERFVSVDKL